MFDKVEKFFEDLSAFHAKSKADYTAGVKGFLHRLLTDIEGGAVAVQVVASAGADKTGPGADVLNAGSAQTAADNSADTLNQQEAAGTLPPLPGA